MQYAQSKAVQTRLKKHRGFWLFAPVSYCCMSAFTGAQTRHLKLLVHSGVTSAKTTGNARYGFHSSVPCTKQAQARSGMCLVVIFVFLEWHSSGTLVGHLYGPKTELSRHISVLSHICASASTPFTSHPGISLRSRTFAPPPARHLHPIPACLCALAHLRMCRHVWICTNAKKWTWNLSIWM